MSIPSGTSGVSSWGCINCSISGVILTQLLEGSCVSIASYGLVMAKQGTGSSSSSIWYKNCGRSGLLHLGKLINLGWVVWHVLVETLIQMMHLRMTHTMFLMVWNVPGSERLGG